MIEICFGLGPFENPPRVWRVGKPTDPNSDTERTKDNLKTRIQETEDKNICAALNKL